MRFAVVHLRRACLAAAIVLAPAPVAAAPNILTFRCQIDGRPRTRVLPPLQERDSYDELLCRVAVTGLGGRSARDLAVELLLLPPDGSYRVVATSHLEPAGGRDRAKLDELVVPHATWAAGIDWRDRKRPRLRLQLRLLDKPAAGDRQWRQLATRGWELGGKPKPPAIAVSARARSARKR